MTSTHIRFTASALLVLATTGGVACLPRTQPAHSEVIANPAFDLFRTKLRSFHTLVVQIGPFSAVTPDVHDARYFPWGPTAGMRNLPGKPAGSWFRVHSGAALEDPWPSDLPRITWEPPQLASLYQYPPIRSRPFLISVREDGWLSIDPDEGDQRLRIGPGGATSCADTPDTLQHFAFGDTYGPVLLSALRSGFDQNNTGNESPESVGFLSPSGNAVWGSASLDLPGFAAGAVHVFLQFNRANDPMSIVITTPDAAMFSRIAVDFDPVIHDRYFEYPCPDVVPRRFPPYLGGSHAGQGPEDAQLCYSSLDKLSSWKLLCDPNGDPEPTKWPFPVVLPRAIGEFAPDSMPLENAPPPQDPPPGSGPPQDPPTNPPQDLPPGGSPPPDPPPGTP